MLTYQLRPRVIRVTGGGQPTFPSDAEINFCLQPLHLFGMAAEGGRAIVRGHAARILWNANTGRLLITPSVPLQPLEVDIHEPSRIVSLEGNQLTIKQKLQSATELTSTLESLYFGLPLLLALEFPDPPVVERVDGRVGDTTFRWELARWQTPVAVTTQEYQQQMFAAAWNWFNVLTAPNRGRLVAALHYFHVACRVRREEEFPGEFIAEALLNFAKILEVLYGSSMDDVRAALSALGYGAEEIERDFIPAMLLRNHVDVGHPMLAVLSSRQLATLHAYADRAEAGFREFLRRLVEKIESGDAEVPPHEIEPADADLRRIVNTMANRLGK